VLKIKKIGNHNLFLLYLLTWNIKLFPVRMGLLINNKKAMSLIVDVKNADDMEESQAITQIKQQYFIWRDR